MAWIFWKYPELIDRVVPWIIVAILWHLTWEIISENNTVKSFVVDRAKRLDRMAWIVAFLIGGGLSLLYLVTAKAAISELSKKETPTVANSKQPPAATTPTNPRPLRPAQAPPLRRPIEAQAAMLQGWIEQVRSLTHADEMWLSQIFQYGLDNRPDDPEVDVPDALKTLASQGKVEILETATRTYRTWWGEDFQEDIRFKVRAASLAPPKKPSEKPASAAETSLKVRTAQLSNDLYGWMVDKEASQPEVYYTNPRSTAMEEQEISAKTEWEKQTLNEYHKQFDGRLVAIKDQLKRCGYNVDSLDGSIAGIGAPFLEVNWGTVLSITHNLSGFSEQLPDQDSDLVCKP